MNSGPRKNRSDGVPEVLACKTGLVTKLLLNPRRKVMSLLIAKFFISIHFELKVFLWGADSPEELVVLCQTLRSARSTGLDLAKKFSSTLDKNRNI